MSTTVDIPGGTAVFLERGQDEIPGRAMKLIRAATVAAMSELSDFPQLLEPPVEGETTEARTERLRPFLEGIRLSTNQAMAWDNMREAAAVALLKSWTLDRPLPTLATIGDLPEELYDTLLEAVGGFSAAEVKTNFAPTGPGESPTGDSGSSDT